MGGRRAMGSGEPILRARKKDLGFIDHSLDKYGIVDPNVRQRLRELIHRQISKQRYTDEEIEELVEDEANLLNQSHEKKKGR
jgi:hypothetical protein